MLISVPNTGVLKTLATISYASLVYYVFLRGIPKLMMQNILSFHMLLVSMYKNTSALVL